MSKPLFTCVMPVKGSRPFMDEALESLRMQGVGDELEIIVQDGDKDPDNGQSDALNRGFAKAHGEWLFWLNADDVLLLGALNAVGELICSNCKCNWITGNLMYLTEGGTVRKCAREYGWRWSYAWFPVRTYGPSSFFRRELFEKVGGLDTSLRFSMDTDLWCKFRMAGEWYKKIAKYLWGFRMHAGSLTTGDIIGNTPPGMAEEQSLIDERYGLSRNLAKVRRLQFTRIIDGSYPLALIDTFRYRGKHWKEVH